MLGYSVNQHKNRLALGPLQGDVLTTCQVDPELSTLASVLLKMVETNNQKV